MELADLNSLRTQVLWATLAVAFVFGFIVQRTHFCTMGAISDIVNMGDWTRMRMWAMAVGVAIIGFYGMAWLGWIDPLQTIYTGGRVVWLSALVGGWLFGLGMVLASGCGSKTLVRIGGGSLKSLVVFIVMGVAAYATLRGLTAVVRVNTVDTVAFNLTGSSAIPLWLNADSGGQGAVSVLALILAFGVALGLIVWAAWSRDFRSAADHWLAGVGIGSTVVALWWVTGVLGFVEEHPETLESVYLATQTGRMESFTFSAPMAHVLDWVIYFSDASVVLTVGVVGVFGVVVGAFVQAWWAKTFQWEGFQSTQDTALHLAGAVCMGVGGVTALGCTIGQGLSGLSTLSLTSVLAVAGIWAGAWIGFKFQIWLIERD
jgi:uncharacterized membrane protein YedE/YeeE